MRTAMFRALSATVAAAALLAGCMHPPHRGGQAGGESIAANPVVFIDPATNRPVVFPEPLFFRKGQTDVAIVWRLPANQGLRFPDDGIVVEGELTHNPGRGVQDPAPGSRVVLVRAQDEIVGCRPIENNAAFTCTNRHTRPGTYKYTVRVVTPGGTVSQDPHIMND